MFKRVLSLLIILLLMPAQICYGKEKKSDDDMGITAKSAILIEVSTGKSIFEKNSDEVLSPASITKIMTLILIFEKLDEKKIMLDDLVTTSDYAKSMGGSQVFLESGEKQTVETLIKCIVIASGNDACVTMAEYIAGSESEFVKLMNEKAHKLGMKNTHFEDCCGLTDSDEHYTTARDVAIMSRELIKNHPDIKKYSTIWMETINHLTDKGNSEFGLSNTNKLLKMNCNFEVTGLKTGSTSKAKYCLSASGKKDGIEMIAVIMAAPDYKVRFSQAQTLLNYGYANCSLYIDNDKNELKEINVIGGTKEKVDLICKEKFSYLALKGENISKISKKITYKNKVKAPVNKFDVMGEITYYIDNKEIGNVKLLAKEKIKKATFRDYVIRTINSFLL